MKTSLLTLALLSNAAAAVQAQSAISAGTIAVGGNIGYSSSTLKEEFKTSSGSIISTENTLNQFLVSPSAGYFFADNLALGLSVGYTASSFKSSVTGPGTTSPNALDARTTFNVGPYVQYYKLLSEQFGLVGTLGAGYQSSFTPFTIGPSTVGDTKGSGFYAGLTPGVIFFPIPKFGISASVGGLGYDRMSFKDSNDKDGDAKSQSSFGLNFGISQLLFGGTLFLGR